MVKPIKLIVFDVDGTLTDGKITLGSDGTEYKNFHVKDGMGISLALKSGIEVAIITGRQSPVVTQRAKELQIPYVYQGVPDKLTKIRSILSMKDYGLEETAFVGDDINDLNVLRVVGFSACPADASEEVKQVCHYVSSKAGGDGAAREIIEYILKSVGSWSELVKKYEGASQ